MDAILLGELTDILGSMSTDSDTKHEEIKSLLNNIDVDLTTIRLNSSHGSAEFSTAGTYTWTCPDGIYVVYVYAIAAGGGGGSYQATGGAGGSGASGAYSISILPVEPKTSYTINVGAGGTGGASVKGSYKNEYVSNYTAYNGTFYNFSGEVHTYGDNGKDGAQGGTTSFGELVVIPGGAGGKGGKVGKRYYTGSTYPSTQVGDGGAGGKGGAVKNATAVIGTFQTYAGKAGSDGKKGNAMNNSGAAATSAPVGYMSCGAGGAGGKGANGYYSNYSAVYYSSGAGSKGSDGYIKIFW